MIDLSTIARHPVGEGEIVIGITGGPMMTVPADTPPEEVHRLCNEMLEVMGTKERRRDVSASCSPLAIPSFEGEVVEINWKRELFRAVRDWFGEPWGGRHYDRPSPRSPSPQPPPDDDTGGWPGL